MVPPCQKGYYMPQMAMSPFPTRLRDLNHTLTMEIAFWLPQVEPTGTGGMRSTPQHCPGVAFFIQAEYRHTVSSRALMPA